MNIKHEHLDIMRRQEPPPVDILMIMNNNGNSWFNHFSQSKRYRKSSFFFGCRIEMKFYYLRLIGMKFITHAASIKTYNSTKFQ